jgi:hypothetical protein
LNKQTEHGALVERKLEESQRARKTMESMLQEVLTAQKRIGTYGKDKHVPVPRPNVNAWC